MEEINNNNINSNNKIDNNNNNNFKDLIENEEDLKKIMNYSVLYQHLPKSL